MQWGKEYTAGFDKPCVEITEKEEKQFCKWGYQSLCDGICVIPLLKNLNDEMINS